MNIPLLKSARTRSRAARRDRHRRSVPRAASCRFQKLLTDNGKEITGRFFASRECDPNGTHEFDQRCHALCEIGVTKLGSDSN